MNQKPVIGIVAGFEPGLGSPGVGMFAESADYVRSVVLAGGVPVLLPVTGEIPDAQSVALLDGLLLPGGGDVAPHLYGQDPIKGMGATCVTKDRFEMALLKICLAQYKPVMGVCRGLQVINVALGGTLIQDLPTGTASLQEHRGSMETRDEPFHRVYFTPGSRLHDMAGQDSLLTNSYHHQAIDRLAPGLRATAHTADGVIEGVEDETGLLYAVQFHPENFTRRFPDFVRFFTPLCEKAAH